MRRREKQSAVSGQHGKRGQARLRSPDVSGSLRLSQSPFSSRGLTMIELMVAMTILIVMVLAFATILTQSRKVVSGAQATIRSNITTAAIALTFREDLRRATQHGFLCITQDLNGVPQLIVTEAGPTPSKTTDVVGTAGMTSYGLCNNTVAANNRPILYFQRWVLTPEVRPAPSDVFSTYDLGNIQILPRFVVGLSGGYPNDINDLISYLYGTFSPDLPAYELSVPPRTLPEIQRLWQVLAADVQALSIMWTDGSTVATGVNWYGVDYSINDNGTPSDLTDDYPEYSVQDFPELLLGDWQGRGADATIGTLHYIQFDSDLPDDYGQYADNTYRALWTHHNQNNWPQAIRIRFRLGGNTDPNDDTTHEVICPVGR